MIGSVTMGRGGHSFSMMMKIQEKQWLYQGIHPIGYEQVQAVGRTGGDTNNNKKEKAAPILLLNGFGVGSFHQHRLMQQLLLVEQQKVDRDIYGMDYLGQGRSWPIDCQDGTSPQEQGLMYSGDT